jgi:hypothetical protein
VNAFTIKKRLTLASASLTLQNLRKRKTETTIAGHSVLRSGDLCLEGLGGDIHESRREASRTASDTGQLVRSSRPKGAEASVEVLRE